MIYQDKFFLFTNGGGRTDAVNWSKDEGGLYPVSKFNGIRVGSPTTLVMYFEGGGTVTLNIKNGHHVDIMTTIGTAVAKDASGIITIADVDKATFIDKHIYGVILS